MISVSVTPILLPGDGNVITLNTVSAMDKSVNTYSIAIGTIVYVLTFGLASAFILTVYSTSTTDEVQDRLFSADPFLGVILLSIGGYISAKVGNGNGLLLGLITGICGSAIVAIVMLIIFPGLIEKTIMQGYLSCGILLSMLGGLIGKISDYSK